VEMRSAVPTFRKPRKVGQPQLWRCKGEPAPKLLTSLRSKQRQIKQCDAGKAGNREEDER
jgi:hypothetical protein